MVTMPPTWGGVGPETTVVTLLALALIVLCTDVNVKFCVTAGAAGGRLVYTWMAWVCAVLVVEVACR